MTDRCLVPWNVYGDGVIRLDFYKDRGIIDYNCVFDNLFEDRDRVFGADFPRSQKTKFGKRLYFTMLEFAEAFFGRNSPRKIARFLQEHLTDETDQSEALINRILNFEKEERVIVTRSGHGEPRFGGLGGGFSSS